MLINEEQAAASAVVFDYLADRYAWELEAWKLGRKRGSYEFMYQNHLLVQTSYEALLARHCAPRVIALKLRAHWGSPPTVNPEKTRIVSMKRDRGAIKVLTGEDADNGFGERAYEYELIEVDGQLRLAERRARFPDRRPIREVW